VVPDLFWFIGVSLTFLELFVNMVFSILLRMHAEGIDAMGHATQLNYGKCFVPPPFVSILLCKRFL
jgi:hypothetical protein